MNEIIVGFDGGEESRDALRLGDWVARSCDARLGVAFVDEIDTLTQVGVENLESRESLYAQVFDQAAEQLGNDEFARHTLIGSVPLALEVVAEETGADMIVVGSTHRGKAGRVIPGSVGDRLLSGAPCSVAVAPRGYAAATPGPHRVIGIGYDGEAEADRALELAQGLAQATASKLRLITVAPSIVALEPGRIAHTAPGYARFLQEHLRDQLALAGDSLDPAIERELEFDEGDAAEVLCAGSETLDLLVLGSRGYGAIRRVLLGGTASRVMRGAQCPVVVVPRSANEPPRGWLRLKTSAAPSA
jgi:nucleotide-binding universal stress UspA family protein